MSVIVVFSTFPTEDKAAEIARTLVSEGHAACANLVPPVRSIYRWQGEVESAEEVAAILKTSQDCAPSLMARIAGLHSHDVPCIVTWPVDKVLRSYADWVEDSTS